MAVVPTGQMPPQGGVEGLLGNSGGLQNLAGNPLFNMGMAMLSNRYDASVNPAEAILGALQTSGAQQRTLEDRQRDEELREKLIEYFKNMQTQQMGQQPGRVEGLLGQGPQFGQQTDPMQSLYRIGWENALNPR